MEYSRNVMQIDGYPSHHFYCMRRAVILELCQSEHLTDQNWELLRYADYLIFDQTRLSNQ